MNLSTLWAVFGFGSLIAAAVMVTKVESAEIGTYSSRFVAVVLAVFAYYGLTTLVDDFPILVMQPVQYQFMKYAVPVVAALGLGYLGWMVQKNWKNETTRAMESGWKLTGIVVLALLGRYFLSL